MDIGLGIIAQTIPNVVGEREKTSVILVSF